MERWASFPYTMYHLPTKILHYICFFFILWNKWETYIVYVPKVSIRSFFLYLFFNSTVCIFSDDGWIMMMMMVVAGFSKILWDWFIVGVHARSFKIIIRNFVCSFYILHIYTFPIIIIIQTLVMPFKWVFFILFYYNFIYERILRSAIQNTRFFGIRI